MKVIRPLVWFKKTYPQLVEFIISDISTQSKKSEDNFIYMWYCWAGTNERTGNKGLPNFYFDKKGHDLNKGLKVLIGQIIVYGKFYDVKDFSEMVGVNIINLHCKKNDIYCKRIAKIIRENFSYYYHNQQELKELYNILKEKS
jgi:hypothetical protein